MKKGKERKEYLEWLWFKDDTELKNKALNFIKGDSLGIIINLCKGKGAVRFHCGQCGEVGESEYCEGEQFYCPSCGEKINVSRFARNIGSCAYVYSLTPEKNLLISVYNVAITITADSVDKSIIKDLSCVYDGEEIVYFRHREIPVKSWEALLSCGSCANLDEAENIVKESRAWKYAAALKAYWKECKLTKKEASPDAMKVFALYPWVTRFVEKGNDAFVDHSLDYNAPMDELERLISDTNVSEELIDIICENKLTPRRAVAFLRLFSKDSSLTYPDFDWAVTTVGIENTETYIDKIMSLGLPFEKIKQNLETIHYSQCVDYKEITRLLVYFMVTLSKLDTSKDVISSCIFSPTLKKSVDICTWVNKHLDQMSAIEFNSAGFSSDLVAVQDFKTLARDCIILNKPIVKFTRFAQEGKCIAEVVEDGQVKNLVIL